MSASTATIVPHLAGSSSVGGTLPNNNSHTNTSINITVEQQQQDDFTTPDRSKLHTGVGTGGVESSTSSTINSHHDEKKEDSDNNNKNSSNTNSEGQLHHPKPATVTPAEASISSKLMGQRDRPLNDDDDEDDYDNDDIGNDDDSKRVVRFDQISAVTAAVAATIGAGNGTDSSSTTSSDSPSKRGLVSRRGGRLASSSPGRALLTSVSPTVNKEAAAAAAAVLEFKTYRSPDRKISKDDARTESADSISVVAATQKEEGTDTVPSLCSTNSMKEEDKDDGKDESTKQQERQQFYINNENNGGGSCSQNKSNKNNQNRAGNAIPPPKTSMLKPKPSSRSSYDKANNHGAMGSRETGKTRSFGPGVSVGGPKKSNVTFSPVPPPKEAMDHRRMRTPVRSPTGGRFTSLPHLDDAAMTSPGIFLSPNTPTRLDRRTKDSSTLSAASTLAEVATKAPLTPKSPRTPRRDLDRFLATPTDFAFDYVGGGKFNSDTSNVLAWLNSPTSNGLFSPGGLGSMLNTPKGGMPRTPRSPSVSTSFFFSDVAGLPRDGEFSPTKHVSADNGTNGGPGGVSGKRGGNERGVASCNSIICISPLASSKSSGRQSGHSPKIDFKDMFASPAERSGMSMLGVGISPTKGLLKTRSTIGMQKGADLDAVHLAERDLMEDEDLSVLLQLASNTPCPSTGGRPVAVSTSDGETAVFRSPESSKSGGGDNLPTLQLSMIGAKDGVGNSARLTRKTNSRDYSESSASDRHIRPSLHTSTSISATRTSSEDSRQDMARPPSTGSMHPTAHPYSITSHYPHHEASYYPPMHPCMSHGGSMRVVVGGPRPSRGSKSPPVGSPPGGAPGMRPYSRGPQGEYPPPYNHYPPRHGVPQPPHMHPLYNPYPPPHHVTPRHGMPIYGGAHGKASSSATSPSKKPMKSSSSSTAATTSAKSGVKRPVPPATITPQSAPPPTKKVKKTLSSSTSTPKKKNRSPQLVDKADRQKAAATIHSVNAASGGMNDKAAALAAAILRGVTMRPSGKWQAQLYFAGKSRYIGVFDTREKAALAYEIARERLKSEKNAEGGALTPKQTEAAVNAARKAAFEGVNERDPRVTGAN